MQPIQLPVTQVGLEQSIQAAMKKAAGSAQINLGTNARQINALSQPLGRITGQADEFTKSMAAANARVLAFGASAGIMAGVSKALAGIVTNTIKVEKSLANINVVLNKSGAELEKFGNQLFDVAKNTGQTFDQVAEAATELARQGLSASETLSRLNDSLILSRLSGLDAAKSVEGLTAAYNSFASSGVTTSQILNKLVVVAQKYAVSEKDLIEGLKRSSAVANQAGVSLDELVGIITAVQEKTARGGAVIGNSFKTIFSRIQDRQVLSDLESMGVKVLDLQNKVLPATSILQNLATSFKSFSQLEQADIAEKLGGIYQLSNLLAAIEDLGSETSKYKTAVQDSAKATTEAYAKNAALNQTLDALINKVTVSAEQLGATLGAIGVTDSLKNVLSFFNGLLEGIQKILGEESALGDLFRGIAKGIGAFAAGPGLALFGAIILKLSKDLVQFGFASLKSFFGIGKAAKEVQSLEMSIQQILSRNVDLQQKLFALEGNRAGQLRLITDALVQQEALLRKTASTASSLGTAMYNVGGRATPSGLRINPPTAAGGYVPAVAKESADISRGVGGARSGDKPVVIPNFNFGGGKMGSMVAHTGEYIVPNFAGKGSAIFNRDMVRSMGLPSGARKINAAGGFIPNFAKELPAAGYRNFNSFEEVQKAATRDGDQFFIDYQGGKYRISKSQFDRASKSKSNQSGIIDAAKLLGSDIPPILTPTEERISTSYSQTLGNGKKLKWEFPAYRLNVAGKENVIGEFQENFADTRIKTFALEEAKKYAEKIVGLLDKKNPIQPDTIDDFNQSKGVKGFLSSMTGAFGGIFDAAVTVGVSAAAEERSKAAAAIGGDFDVNMQEGSKSYEYIKKLFGGREMGKAGGVRIADFKINAGKNSTKSMAEKVNKTTQLDKKIESGVIKAAGGYIPNFVNPLQDAVDREMAAGVPASQIYIDKNPKLKSASNPMGLMVANRRDEPAGGFQGINRAMREGRDPKTYGAAGGFIPNYAPQIGQVTRSDVGRSSISDQAIDSFNVSLKQISDQLRKGAISFADANSKMSQLAQATGSNKSQVAKLTIIGGNLITAYNNELTARNQKAQQLRQDRAENRIQPKVAGGGKDMLGIIFAVQSAMTALSGATGDATNGIGKFTNVVSDGIATFSTAAFALQGIGSLGGKIGAFASKLGPYGMAAAGLFAAFKVGKGLYEEYSGANKRAANSALLLAKAAENAAYSIDKYSPQGKKDVENTVNSILKTIDLRGVSDPEMAKIKEAVTFAVSSGTSNQSIIDSFIQNTDRKQEKITYGTSMSGTPNTVTYDYRTLKGGDSEAVVRELGKLGSQGDVKALSALQDYITQGRSLDIISSLPGLDSFQGGGNTAKKIAELTKDPANIQRAITDLNAASSEKKPVQDIKDGASDLAKILEGEDTNRARTIDFLEKVAKYREEEAKRKGEEAAESDELYRVNTTRIKAEADLNLKLLASKNKILSLEMEKEREIAKLTNDATLSEDERAKQIAKTNNLYEKRISDAKTLSEVEDNINRAILDSLSGRTGVDQNRLSEFVKNISGKLPKLDLINPEEIDKFTQELEKITRTEFGDNSSDIFKALSENLLKAKTENKGITDEQKNQIRLSAKDLGIKLDTLDVTRQRVIEEAKISAMMDSAKSLADFNLEQRSLDIAYDILSVNQEIEKVKRDSSLNELEKAKEIFKLEEKRAGLEEGKITVDYDKAATDAARAFQDRILSTAKGFEIEPRMISGSLSGGPEAVIDAARAQIPPKDQKSFDQLIADQRADYERSLTLAGRRRDLDKSGVGPVLESEIQRRAREGFSGGINDGVNKLQDSMNTFAFDIGEKIPQMFSDNMSNAINKMIEGGESFSNVLRGAAYEFVKGINQANIKNLSDKFSNFLFKSDGGAASGIKSVLGLASGGKVSGGSGSKDDVPAMLMGGEYVINKNAVRKYGPQFFDSINKGQLSGFAAGGKVPKQTGPQGNFYTPGTYGTGAIEGKRNLLDFATQSGTSGQFDRIVNMEGYQSIALEPESALLSVSGMRNSPAFEATQSAKQQAFDLYLQQYQQEKEAQKIEKEQKKAFRNQLLMLVGSAALSYVGSAAASGMKANITAAEATKGGALTFKETLFAGSSGAFKGGMIDGQSVGGLNKLFSGIGSMATGNFKGGFNQMRLSQIGTSEQLSKAITGYGNRGFAEYLGVAPRASIISGPNSAMAGSSMPIGIARTGAGVVQNSNIGYVPPDLPTSNLAAFESQRRRMAFDILTKDWGFDDDQARDWIRTKSTNEIDRLNANYTRIDPVPAKATGGMIPSTSGIDTVPAMLSGGEFIMNRSAVQNIGAGNLQSMNSGTQSVLTDEASKEMNEKLLSKLDELIEVSSGGGDITVNVSGSGSETTTGDKNQDTSALKQQIAREVKDAVLKVLDEQKRLGGRLRR